jgi:hypothetical protein
MESVRIKSKHYCSEKEKPHRMVSQGPRDFHVDAVRPFVGSDPAAARLIFLKFPLLPRVRVLLFPEPEGPDGKLQPEIRGELKVLIGKKTPLMQLTSGTVRSKTQNIGSRKHAVCTTHCRIRQPVAAEGRFQVLLPIHVTNSNLGTKCQYPDVTDSGRLPLKIGFPAVSAR